MALSQFNHCINSEFHAFCLRLTFAVESIVRRTHNEEECCQAVVRTAFSGSVRFIVTEVGVLFSAVFNDR